MDKINDRIIELAKHYGVNKASDFSRSTGLSHQVSSNYLKGLKKPSVDALEKIQTSFDSLNPMWLLTGQGEMLKENISKAELAKPTNKSEAYPLVSIKAVGGFGNSDFSIGERDIKDFYVIPKFKDRKIDFMIEVSGSSMYPKYNSGDVVACRIIRESRFIQWNKVHVIATEEQGILIKRLKKTETKESLLAISDNKDYDPFEIPKEEIKGLAIVVGVIRVE